MNNLHTVAKVTGHFGQDPIRPEKTWTFRPRNIDVSAKEDGRFGQKRWTFRPEKVDVSARKKWTFRPNIYLIVLRIGYYY